MMLIVFAAGLENDKVEYYLNRGLRAADDKNVPLEQRSSLWNTAARAHLLQGRLEACRNDILCSIDSMTQFWHTCVRYVDDHRLANCLVPIQTRFLECYSIQRELDPPDQLFGSILRFKSLASLAGRERNRVIRTARIDSDLVRRIQQLLDTIAMAEAADALLPGTVSKGNCDSERRELRRLEAEFAKKYPVTEDFQDLSIHRWQKALPEHSAVIEYFFTPNLKNGDTEGSEKNCDMELDVYIAVKQDGKVSLWRRVISEGEAIYDQAEEYVRLIQTPQKAGNASALCSNLYERLLAPVVELLEGFSTIYVAPDLTLMNVPFELLRPRDGQPFGAHRTIIHMECSRDFLFSSLDDGGDGKSLVMGGAQYSIRTKEKELLNRADNGNDDVRTLNDEIKQLPFAELEAQNTGRYVHTAPVLGKDARKDVLLNGKGLKHIHLATHGSFDMQQDALFSSCLFFAGAEDWRRTGAISEIYGNGVVTADEISRMDLQGVELTVLSTCLSGLSGAQMTKGTQGLVGAFASAGVRYMITHLWDANDFAAAVLMYYFYFFYVKKRMTPPKALWEAKNAVQQTTLRDLDRQGWFRTGKKLLQRYHIPPIEINKYERLIQIGKDDIRPFVKERYWAGFACYQCRR